MLVNFYKVNLFISSTNDNTINFNKDNGKTLKIISFLLKNYEQCLCDGGPDQAANLQNIQMVFKKATLCTFGIVNCLQLDDKQLEKKETKVTHKSAS